MGFFDSVFKSDKDNFMEDQDRRSKYLLDEIKGMKGSNADVNNLGDVTSKFGIDRFNTADYRRKVGDVFAPRRQSLGNALARDRSARARRMTGRETQPEFMFSSADSNYYDSMNQLESAMADQELQGFDKEMAQNNFLGSFLQDILSGKDQYGLRKSGLQLQGENDRLSIGDRMDDSSLFNDLTSIGSTLTKFLPGPQQAFGAAKAAAGGIGSSLTRGLGSDFSNIKKKGYRL